MSKQVARLQSAVQEMLHELNIYQEQESIGRVREVTSRHKRLDCLFLSC